MDIPEVRISTYLSELVANRLLSLGRPELLTSFSSGRVSKEDAQALKDVVNNQGPFSASSYPVIARDLDTLVQDMNRATGNGNESVGFSFRKDEVVADHERQEDVHEKVVQNLAAKIEEYLANGLNVPSHQQRYFIRLYKAYLRELGGINAPLDLECHSTTDSMRMSEEERKRHIIEIADIENDPDLLALAKDISVMMIELNGGLGSRVGLDPSEHHSKAIGISMNVSIETPNAQDTAYMPILEAKLRALAGLTRGFKEVHVMPFNSTLTRDGWYALMNWPTLESRNGLDDVDNFTSLSQAGLIIHEELLQSCFPKIGEMTDLPMDTGNPDMDLAPGGDGQVLHELYYSGRLQELYESGIQVLVIGDAENIQARPHPAIAAKMVRDEISLAIVSTDRTPADTTSAIFVIRNGELKAIEPHQVARSQKHLFAQIGLGDNDAPQPYNTNTVYINVPLCLSEFRKLASDLQDEKYGDYNFHALLMPNTIANKRNMDIGEQSIIVRHLEGSLISVLMNFNNVRLFNASAQDRWKHVATIKNPADYSYLYNSDAFEVDPQTGELKPLTDDVSQPAITLQGWHGWSKLHETVGALGNGSSKTSMRDLRSLHIEGDVHIPSAVLRGDVRIKSRFSGSVDLSKVDYAKWLPSSGGQLLLTDVSIEINHEGKMIVKNLDQGLASTAAPLKVGGGASSMFTSIYQHDYTSAAFMGGFMGTGLMGVGLGAAFNPAMTQMAAFPV